MQIKNERNKSCPGATTNITNEYAMKLTTSPLALLALLFSLGRVLASDSLPLRFLLTSITVEETHSVARLQVLRADDADHPITVDFLTEPASATPAADYTPVAGTLTFSPGEHFKLIEVPILNDGSTESPEKFRVVLTNATALGISQTFGVATITIRDNDPGFGFETSTYRPGENQNEVVLNVRRGSDLPETITVDYAVEPDTATAGIDYQPVSGTLSFGPNDPIQAIRVPILQDSLKEAVESFRVILSNPSAGASVGLPSTATVWLSDNDPGFSFDGSSYTVSESQGEAVLYVYRGTDAPDELSVDYATEPISASAGLDYTPVSGTLTFTAGQSGMIRVPILNDGLKEGVETFRVRLSNPSAGVQLWTPSVATVRIESNDSGFGFLGGSNYSVSEDGRVILSVDRGNDISTETSVEYATEPVSATPDVDYTAVSGRLVFTPNTYSLTIEIPLLNDRLPEATESFRVLLRNPSPGTSLGAPSVATVRIPGNDQGFYVGSSYSVGEVDREVYISVYRGTDPEGEASVDYSVEPDSATAGVDYTSVSGTLTFIDKEIYKTIRIPILDDAVQETVETFRVILSNPSPGSFLGSPAVATVRIMDTDGFHFGSSTYAVIESDSAAVLPVYRNSTDTTSAASVDYTVEPNTASPDLDYTPVGGTLLFAAGEYSKTISVPILNDTISEGSESFTVVLNSPMAGDWPPTRIRVTIQDNDFGFFFDCAPGAPYCGNPPEHAEAAKIDVVIRGDFQFSNPVSVDFTTEAGTATPNVDFLATSGTLTFAPGETRKTISIPLLNDGLLEANESFRVALQNPVGLTQASALPRFTFNIQDNEHGYSIESNTEDGRLVLPRISGDVLINVRREADLNYTTSVDFRTSEFGEQGTTAYPGIHFAAAAGTLTFAPGETNKTITLRLLGARRVRVVEQFLINLSNPTDGLPINATRWIEIRPDERNLLQVDAGFDPEVRYARGTDLQVLPDGRVVMATPLPYLTGEDGFAIVRLLRDGTLDPSFAPASTSGMQLLALQTNAQVLVAGQPGLTVNGTTPGPLARLEGNGALDSTFLAQLPNISATVTALAAQADGRILVAADDNTLVRLDPNGSLDRSFQPITNVAIRRIVVDKDGQALILGDFATVRNKPRPGMARLLADGSLDASFLAEWPLGSVYRFEPEAEGTCLITYYDDKLGLQLARLTKDGRLDPTFRADARLGSIDQSFFPAPDRKVLISEITSSRGARFDAAMVSRLNADGSLDESFGAGTYTVTFVPSGTWDPSTYSITVEPGGDLLLKGDIGSVNGMPGAGLGRLLINGGSPPVSIDPASTLVLETNGFVNVTLVRSGNTSSAYTINWATDGGAALPGVDFLEASGTVTFASGESDHTISLQLLDNQKLDGERTVRLRLTTPDGTVLPSVTFVISNDDLGFVPGLSYAFPHGRFLMNITGNRARGNVLIQRSTDPRYWEDWMMPGSQTQIIDNDYLVQDGPRMFYRLVGYIDFPTKIQ